MIRIIFTGLFFTLFLFSCSAQQENLKMVKTYKIGGEGGWDYIALNDQKLYVSHGTRVNIIDEASGDSTGVIEGTTGVHGIAFDSKLNKGYTSNGRLDNVSVFDLNTNKILNTIATGGNPDAIMYDEFSNKIITCNGRGKSLSIIDPAIDSVVATIALDGRPEEAVSDHRGTLYVNLEDKNTIAVIDLQTYNVKKKWPISPGEGATGLAMDISTNRLFAGCDNDKLMVLDAKSGKVITSVSIGSGCDGVAFDEEQKLIYTSNGEGNVTVIKETDANHFEKVQTIQTKKGARTLVLDPQSHTLFLPTADVQQLPAAADGSPQRKIIPGTFCVLVVQ
ncbi:MAG: YncE family protein [Ginsengibacter sp.]